MQSSRKLNSSACGLLALSVWVGSLWAASNTPSEPMAGIDHVPTVVADLDAAVAQFQALGFVIKPGRPHADGLLNAHLKFPDGSGVELIQPPAVPTDTLTREYLRLLNRGEGPVFLALHVRDTDALRRALDRARIGYTESNGSIQPDDPQLRFLFLVRDNRSPSDRPEHFAHPNTAYALSMIWIAADASTRRRISYLLTALGSPAAFVSAAPEAAGPDPSGVFSMHRLLNGCIVLLPGDPQQPLRAMQFTVADLARISEFKPHGGSAPSQVVGARLSFSDRAQPPCGEAGETAVKP